MRTHQKYFLPGLFIAVVSEEKWKITKFFPDTTVFMIKKPALRTNEIKRYSAINQLYRIIHTFDSRRTLKKYLRTFLHENAVLVIGLTDQ